MRTKALLCAAAVAAGALSAMAQSNVYSLNVVGYVNVPLVGGGAFNMIANPLNNTGTGGNNISNLFSAVAQDGDTIFLGTSIITTSMRRSPPITLCRMLGARLSL
jgi:hypothetical protein